MKRRRFYWALAIGILSIPVLLVITFRRSPTAPDKLASDNPLRFREPLHLNVRLAWLVNANSAGQIIAKEKGFYGEEGLEVAFHEGGLMDPAVRTVASGTDDLGFANGPELVIAARAAGAPVKIVAVIHQDGYHAFFSREDSGILTPKDWVGRRVGIKVGSPTFLYYQAILSKLGINRSAVHEVPLGYDLRPFIAGEVDVYPGAITNEAVALEERGIPLRRFSPIDCGIESMGNVLFTTDAAIRDRSDMIRRFVRATMRGWAWCAKSENWDTVIDHLHSYNPKIERTKERRALEISVRLIGKGNIDQGKLSDIISNQVRFGGLPRVLQVEDVANSDYVD